MDNNPPNAAAAPDPDASLPVTQADFRSYKKFVNREQRDLRLAVERVEGAMLKIAEYLEEEVRARKGENTNG